MPALCMPDGLVVEAVRFPAGPYQLEGELSYPDTTMPRGAVLLAGPHPLLGGSMHNNVVRGLGDGLARHGLVALRFNYRGVGASEGPAVNVAEHLARFWETAHVPDETAYQEDLVGAIDQVRSVVGPALPLALVGYSFGCTLLPAGLEAAGSDPLFVLIAPTLGTHDYGAFAVLDQPKLVIAPEGDFAADRAALAIWFDRLRPPKEMMQPRLDTHFFRGHESWLATAVADFLERAWR